MKLVELPSSLIQCKNLVYGKWKESLSKNSLDVTSPYTGLTIGRVPLSTSADLDEVVAGAKAAALGWRTTPIKERCAFLFKFRELMLQRLDKLSNTAAAEAACPKQIVAMSFLMNCIVS